MDLNFLSCPRIVCKPGALAQIGQLMYGLGASRVLLVTDPGIVACGFSERAITALADAGIATQIFDRVAADPPIAVVKDAVASAQSFRADAVIGLGGGSSLDTAKVVALAAASGQSVDDMIGVDKAKGGRLPLIQIPTTAGTGSEVTWVSVLTSENQEKLAVYAPQLLPDIALLDAELTLGMPRKITAATALDAMVHAIEAATSRTRKNPISDGLADKALALLGQNLPRVLEVPSDLAAREAVLLGATLAGIAFINASVGSIHALSYPLGSHFHIPHGHGNALVTAPVLRFNLVAAESEYARLAGVLLPSQTFSDDFEAANALISAIEAMFASSGLETRLSQLGISAEAIPTMAREVTTGITRLLANNPRDMSFDDVVALYEQVL
ncbi:iron-containing alcohol dehydrogenase [Sphingobium xenophagum]